MSSLLTESEFEFEFEFGLEVMPRTNVSCAEACLVMELILWPCCVCVTRHGGASRLRMNAISIYYTRVI